MLPRFPHNDENHAWEGSARPARQSRASITAVLFLFGIGSFLVGPGLRMAQAQSFQLYRNTAYTESNEQTAFEWGATVYAYATGLNIYRCYWFVYYNNNVPQYVDALGALNTANLSEYTLPTGATASGTWQVELWQGAYNDGRCAAGELGSNPATLQQTSSFDVARTVIVGAGTPSTTIPDGFSPAGGDATVDESNNIANYGLSDELKVRSVHIGTGGAFKWAFLRFDIASAGIPSTATLDKATVRLWMTQAPTYCFGIAPLETCSKQSRNYVLSRVAVPDTRFGTTDPGQDWSEGSIVWGRADTVPQPAVDLYGAVASTGNQSGQYVRLVDLAGVPGLPPDYPDGLIFDVQGFVDGSSPNLGWRLNDFDGSGWTDGFVAADIEGHFSSTEESQRSKRPVLLIDWEGGEVPQASLSTQIRDSGNAVGTSFDLGTSVHDRATISFDGGGNTPTNSTITFQILKNPNGDCSSGTPVGSSNQKNAGGLSSGQHVDSVASGALGAGNYAYKVTFASADTELLGNPAAPTCEPFTVNKSQLTVASQVHDAQHSDVTDGIVPNGSVVHDTAAITAGLVTGFNPAAITFQFWTNGTCDGAGVSVNNTGADGGDPTLDRSAASTALATGHYSYKASVADNSSYLGADSGCEPFEVHNPSATGQSVSTNEDTIKTITLNGTDSDGHSLTFFITTGPTHGSLGMLGGVSCSGNPSSCDVDVDYMPDPNYNGADSFAFKVNDGFVDSSQGTVQITVYPVNDKPTANGQSVSTNEDTDKPITLTGSDVETAAGNLTFTVTQNPAHGSLSGTPPNVTYSPNSNYNGSDSFKFKVTDRGDPDNCGTPSATCAAALDSDAATVQITVYPVNDPPVLTSPGNKSVAWGDSLSFTLSASDVETSGSSLAYTIDSSSPSLPAGASLTTAGAFSWTPSSGDVGDYSVTFKVTDSGDPNGCSPVSETCSAALSDTKTVTITVDKRATTLTNNGAFGGQYSDQVNVSATLTDSETGDPITGKDVYIDVGTQSAQAYPTTTNASGKASSDVVLDQPAGTVALVSSFSEDAYYLGSSDTDDFEINPEDASVETDDSYDGAFKVANAGNSGVYVELSGKYWETNSPEPTVGDGANPGDITNAVLSVVLVPIGPGGPITLDCHSGALDGGAGTYQVQHFTCKSVADDADWNSPDESDSANWVPVNAYAVEMTINTAGYYEGSNEDVLTVYDPSLGTTGGGYLFWPGEYDPDTNPCGGAKTNFGFTMKYNHKQTSVQGNLLMICHVSNSELYRFKSNSLDSTLAIATDDTNPDDTFGWAAFSGKGTFGHVDSSGATNTGNYSFQAYVEDHADPGAGADKYWIEIKDGNGDVVGTVSVPEPAVDNALVIDGGNIVVPHQTSNGGGGRNK